MANNTQFTYNPLTGYLDAGRAGDTITDAVQATRIVLTFDCEASAALDDVVYQSTLDNSKVLVNTNNTEVQSSIGVIITKPTSTTCEVIVLGIKSGYSGLSIGNKVFLDTDGTTTSTKPATGYVQTLGIAVAPDTIFFQPNATRVLQTP